MRPNRINEGFQHPYGYLIDLNITDIPNSLVSGQISLLNEDEVDESNPKTFLNLKLYKSESLKLYGLCYIHNHNSITGSGLTYISVEFNFEDPDFYFSSKSDNVYKNISDLNGIPVSNYSSDCVSLYGDEKIAFIDNYKVRSTSIRSLVF